MVIRIFFFFFLKFFSFKKKKQKKRKKKNLFDSFMRCVKLEIRRKNYEKKKTRTGKDEINLTKKKNTKKKT